MDGFFAHAVKQFPEGIEGAFAYGSGVFQQKNNKPSKENMVDLILIVKDPILWHQANLAEHPAHYSFIKHLGPSFIANLQCSYGAHVYFNTLVEFEGRMIKYGVISVSDFLHDLRDWSTLYISGRLHKPVLKTEEFINGSLKNAFKKNLANAVTTSLLMLPEEFEERDLYLTITGLSYLGDFRMIFGEDKNKVKNIVLPNMDYFKLLYKETVEKIPNMNISRSRCFQDCSPKARLETLNSLPLTLKRKLLNYSKAEIFDPSSMLLKNPSLCSALVAKSVGSIVRYPSITQSVKGIMTAGFKKSVFYSLAKIQKMAKSMFK